MTSTLVDDKQSYPKCNPLFQPVTHTPSTHYEKNVKSSWIIKEKMIQLVRTKLEGQGCWLKGISLTNFKCNSLSYDEFPFHFFVWFSYSNSGWNTNHPPSWSKNVPCQVVFLNKRHTAFGLTACLFQEIGCLPWVLYTFKITLTFARLWWIGLIEVGNEWTHNQSN